MTHYDKDYRKSFGRWHVMPENFMRAFTWEQANFLAYLANIEYVVQARERNGGWFYANVKRMEASIGCSRKKQWRHIRALTDLGVLNVKSTSKQVRRLIQINWDMVADKIDCLPETDFDDYEG